MDLTGVTRGLSPSREAPAARALFRQGLLDEIVGVQPSSRLALALDATLSLPSEATVSCVVKMRGAPE